VSIEIDLKLSEEAAGSTSHDEFINFYIIFPLLSWKNGIFAQ